MPFSINQQSWRDTSFTERLAVNMVGYTLYPLQRDQRVTVLMSLLVFELSEMFTGVEEIDVTLDILRIHLRDEVLRRHHTH
jgi:hypothetical protein